MQHARFDQMGFIRQLIAMTMNPFQMDARRVIITHDGLKGSYRVSDKQQCWDRGQPASAQLNNVRGLESQQLRPLSRLTPAS